jgi:hypothetical protein
MGQRQPRPRLHAPLALTRVGPTYAYFHPEHVEHVSTVISFGNLPSDDYEAVTLSIQMTGETFNFTAELTYYNQVLLPPRSYSRPWAIVCSFREWSACRSFQPSAC